VLNTIVRLRMELLKNVMGVVQAVSARGHLSDAASYILMVEESMSLHRMSASLNVYLTNICRAANSFGR
jgi:hypothetical protein